MFDGLAWMFLLIFGFVLIAILLPAAGSLVIDGSVTFFRRRRLAPLLIALGATAATALIGVVVWKLGVARVLDHDPVGAFAQTMRNTIAAFLPYTIGLALLAALVRAIKSR